MTRTRTLSHLASVAAAFGLLFAPALTAPASAAPAGAAAPLAASSTCNRTTVPAQCSVDQPVVTQFATAYPAVQIRPGDHLMITAGGCVQTGGHGATWKRYVNPAADNDLYHGRISIPGVTPGLVRLESVVNQTFSVPQNGGGTLVLGYEDGDYSDNGYYAHDNGTANQCQNLGAAWVHIAIF